MVDQDKAQYDTVAVEYASYDELPMAKLEGELIRTALGACPGAAVLDLGGGSGTHARAALAAGASRVDVVDISDGMMGIGKELAEKAGVADKINWDVADASKPLMEQGVTILLGAGQYDIVMANWVFDHAHSFEDLTGMWANIVTALKPGGKFLGIRVTRPGIFAEYVSTGKYGCRYEDIQEIPGGWSMMVFLLTNPPFSFGGTVMSDSADMTNEIPKKMGMTDFKLVPTEEAEIIKKDPDFWKEHLELPLFAVVTATKGE
jgi:toxoflavin synthase